MLALGSVMGGVMIADSPLASIGWFPIEKDKQVAKLKWNFWTSNLTWVCLHVSKLPTPKVTWKWFIVAENPPIFWHTAILNSPHFPKKTSAKVRWQLWTHSIKKSYHLTPSWSQGNVIIKSSSYPSYCHLESKPTPRKTQGKSSDSGELWCSLIPGRRKWWASFLFKKIINICKITKECFHIMFEVPLNTSTQPRVRAKCFGVRMTKPFKIPCLRLTTPRRDNSSQVSAANSEDTLGN